MLSDVPSWVLPFGVPAATITNTIPFPPKTITRWPGSSTVPTSFPPQGRRLTDPSDFRVPLVPKAVLDEISQLKEDVAETEGLLKATADKEYREFAKGLIPETARYMVAASEYRSALAAGRELSLAAVAAKRQLREYALRQWG